VTKAAAAAAAAAAATLAVMRSLYKIPLGTAHQDRFHFAIRLST